MDFVFDSHTLLPAHAQIQEQIKMALLLGRLRPGDTLPSIRDVEKQVGISRNLVRKAYLELQSWGVLKLRHGKGVIVDANLQYGEKEGITQKSETLSHEMIARVRQVGVSPTAFANYLRQRARADEMKKPFVVYVEPTRWLAEERAATISDAWRLEVPGISIKELRAMDAATKKGLRKVLTSYMRYDQVLQAIKAKEPEVIPLGMTIERQTVREFGALKRGSSVVFVVDDPDYPSLSIILDPLKDLVENPSVTFESTPWGKIKDMKRFVRSKQYSKVLFSNHVWDRVPNELKKDPKVIRPHMTINLASLESVRIRSGIIV
jgi:GntR family transcriptional regulator